MIDISFKAKIGTNKEKIVLALEKKGAKIKKGKEEILRVFFKNDINNNSDIYNIFKIKKEDDKTILSFKKKDEKNGKFIKLESLVSDEEVIAEIINQMGYSEEFEIKLKRTKYILDGLAINIDYIEDMDYFIEINKTVTNKEDEIRVRSNIENLFSEIGITKNEYILDSYEVLKYNLKNK